MALVDVKCLNCGGSIRTDDALQKSFCMYCGSEFEVKQAVNQVKLAGSVEVNGIASRDKLLKNALQFIELEDFPKALELLDEFTTQYPEYFCGWWYTACANCKNWSVYPISVYSAVKMLENALNTADDPTIKELIQQSISEYKSGADAAHKVRNIFSKQKYEQESCDRKISGGCLLVISFVILFALACVFVFIPIVSGILLILAFIVPPILTSKLAKQDKKDVHQKKKDQASKYTPQIEQSLKHIQENQAKIEKALSDQK